MNHSEPDAPAAAAPQTKPAINYSCCFAKYCMPGGDPNEIVRVTCAVVDLRTDQIVEHIDVWLDEDDLHPDEVAAHAVDLAAEYDCNLTMLETPVPAAQCSDCPCGCYLVRVIRSRDHAPEAAGAESESGARGSRSTAGDN